MHHPSTLNPKPLNPKPLNPVGDFRGFLHVAWEKRIFRKFELTGSKKLLRPTRLPLLGGGAGPLKSL